MWRKAWFIKEREPGQGDRSIPEILRECFRDAYCMTISANKDTFGNIGGWLVLNEND